MYSILCIALAVCVGSAVLGYAAQGLVIFPASRDIYRTPASGMGWNFEDVVLPVGNHTTHAWYIPVENARGTVLFSHGNAGNIADRLESVSMFRPLGLNVLVYDYGGYGRSTGRPSEKRCYEDIRAMWRYLTEERGVTANRIVLFGRSLGGGATADLAAEVTPAAVILESTFLSLPEIVHDMPFGRVIPMHLLLRHIFDNAAKVSRITSPVLFIHSPDDTLIPIRHGRALFERAPEPKQFLEIHGEHNIGFVESKDLWMETMARFLDPLLPAAP